ncbi:MAG TPA: hypothetical protein VFH68_20270, partial [Polyangia bacterium]|nr:hypothetical protein [Polyangia bacterium]
MPAALTAIACLLAAHVGLGCGTPARTFFVVQNQAPAQGTDCVIPGDRGANARGRGLLDAGLLPADTSTGYLLFPLLENDFPAEGSGDHEPNR